MMYSLVSWLVVDCVSSVVSFSFLILLIEGERGLRGRQPDRSSHFYAQILLEAWMRNSMPTRFPVPPPPPVLLSTV